VFLFADDTSGIWVEGKAILPRAIIYCESVNMNVMIMLNWDAGMWRGRGQGEGGRGGCRGDVRNVSQLI